MEEIKIVEVCPQLQSQVLRLKKTRYLFYINVTTRTYKTRGKTNLWPWLPLQPSQGLEVSFDGPLDHALWLCHYAGGGPTTSSKSLMAEPGTEVS